MANNTPTSTGHTSSSWSVNLTTIRRDMITIAKQASTMILAATTSTDSSSSAINTKNNSADLVTETDAAVEALISKYLMAKYPTFKFLGEETYVPGQKLGPEPTFVVDPIDGTTNFVHRHPYVSVSVGFAVERKPVVGVVVDVFRGRMYVGTKGQGAFVVDLKGHQDGGGKGEGEVGEGERWRRLPTQEPREIMGLDECVVAVEWGSDRSGENWRVKCETWRKLGASKEEGGAMVHSARALGSAALNLCGVAEGHLDLYWEGGCWAWDVCAGWVILEEAGGRVVDGNPGGWEVPVDHRKYLAVRGARKGQKEVVEEFWGFCQGVMEYES